MSYCTHLGVLLTGLQVSRTHTANDFESPFRINAMIAELLPVKLENGLTLVRPIQRGAGPLQGSSGTTTSEVCLCCLQICYIIAVNPAILSDTGGEEVA